MSSWSFSSPGGELVGRQLLGRLTALLNIFHLRIIDPSGMMDFSLGIVLQSQQIDGL